MNPVARVTRARMLMGLGAAGCIVLAVGFLTINAVGDWGFVLSLRGSKLVTIALVAWAIPFSTVLFHTLSNNQILTPSIMGFDALFVLVQTLGVFILGSVQVSILDPHLVFAGELVVMSAFSMALYWLLYARMSHAIEVLLLVGIICGVLFRSVAGLLQRLIDPGEFLVLQDRLFASFNSASSGEQACAALIICLSTLWAWVRFPSLDAMLLGRSGAVAVGVNYDRIAKETFLIVTLQVAAATALVGPITFFGLLVVHLTYRLLPGAPHRLTIPLSVLIGGTLLIGAQVILERLLGFLGTVGMVVEFIGGIAFILLLIGSRK